MTIPWTTLKAEEKAAVFWKAVGVEPLPILRTYLPWDGHSESAYYPPLTLDTLFAFSREKGLLFDRIYQDRYGRWIIFIVATEKCSTGESLIDALAIAIMRFSGHTIT